MQYMKFVQYFFIGLLCLSHHQIRGAVFGFDNKIAAELAFFTFPSGQTDNRLAPYGLAGNGFAIANSSTSAVFDSVFPVSGTVNLNGGTLTLSRDLLFTNPTTLQGLGTINGSNHVIEFADNTTSLPANTSRFQDAKLVLNNDITLSSAITFTGVCYIEGNGYQLIMGNNGGIRIGNNSTLLLHNVVLNGVNGSNVRCLNDFGLIILDGVKWIQSGNTNFLVGALQFRNNVTMAGQNVFAYQTLRTSLVAANATLALDAGFTFSYDPVRLGSKSLLQFSDASSTLFLNSSSLYTTTTGLNLTRGSLVVRGDSLFSSEVRQLGLSIIDNGITLGDGASSINDFKTTILAGARLKIVRGSLNYRNILNSSWKMENSISLLNMGAFSTLRLYQTLDLGLGAALCDQAVTIARVSQAQLLGSVSAISDLFFAQL